jgi:hypothetical protein
VNRERGGGRRSKSKKKKGKREEYTVIEKTQEEQAKARGRERTTALNLLLDLLGSRSIVQVQGQLIPQVPNVVV